MPVRGVFSLATGAENGENVDDDEDIVVKYFYAVVVVTDWSSKKQYSEDGRQDRWNEGGCELD